MRDPSAHSSNGCASQPSSDPSPTRLREAQPEDVTSVRTLLATESLPLEGVDSCLMQSTAVVRHKNVVVGCASVEVHGRVGLLRSVAVAASLRQHGWGRRLVEDRIRWARGQGLYTLALFTETTPEFFARLGFKHVPRAQLPREVHGSFEFGFCPEASKSMRLELAQNADECIARRYSQAARRPTPAKKGSGLSLEGCGYDRQDTAVVPPSVASSFLGCGNPAHVAELAAGEVVLDLGSGAGLDVLLSARRVGPTGFAYGLDTNADMLAAANQNLIEAELDNARFLEGKIEAIPMEDAQVDVVLSNCVINLSVDKERTYREAYRVLRPGGRMAIADIVARHSESSVARRSAEAALGCLAGTLSVTEVDELLREVGFDQVSVEVVRAYGAQELQDELDDATAAEAHELLLSAIVRAVKPKKGSANQ